MPLKQVDRFAIAIKAQLFVFIAALVLTFGALSYKVFGQDKDIATLPDVASTDSQPAPVAASPDPQPAPVAVNPAATAPQAAPVDVEKNPVGAVEAAINAIRDKNWRMLAALALAMLMLGLTRVRSKIKWFKGDRGGAILVAVLGLLGAFIAALQSSATIDYKLILGTMGLVWTAVGGVTWVKRIIWPKEDVIDTAKMKVPKVVP